MTREPGGMWSRAACTSGTTRTGRASFMTSFASCTQPASHPSASRAQIDQLRCARQPSCPRAASRLRPGQPSATAVCAPFSAPGAPMRLRPEAAGGVPIPLGVFMDPCSASSGARTCSPARALARSGCRVSGSARATARASPSTQDAIPLRPLHPIGSLMAPSDSQPWLSISWSHQ